MLMRASSTARSAPCVPPFRARARSAPGLLPLPAAGAADAALLGAEIELADVVLLEELRARPLHHDAADLEDVAVVRGVERHVRVLLDEEHRHPALAVDPGDDLE